MERLDRFLSEAGVESRRKIKEVIRSGRVTVNGEVVRLPDRKIDETTAVVTLDGERIGRGERTVVIMMHKPAGCVTAASDAMHRTVMEYLPERYRRLMPIGRLDKETEGLLLFTNDGDLLHRLISPKQEVPKVYYARHEGQAGEADVAAFAAGLTLGDGTACRPAVLKPLGPGESLITVCEGKYHQVRRMMASRNMTVTYLERRQEGPLTLGNLPRGQARELLPEEIGMLENR